MLSLKLIFDKYTAQLHLPQGGRKTGAMQLRFFLYDSPLGIYHITLLYKM